MRRHQVTEIYTDGTGVAPQIEAWARERSIPTYRITGNFMHDGPATLPERNITLVAITRLVIAFPGGASDHLVTLAKKVRRSVVECPPPLAPRPIAPIASRPRFRP